MLRSLLAASLLVLVATASYAAAPDYGAYQSLLDHYLVRLEPDARETDTCFDYEKLHMDQNIWRTHHSPLLERIHAQLLAVRPSELSAADRTAWAINTYNFLVIERASMRLLLPGRKFQRYHAVEDMHTAQGAFFVTPVGEIEGRSYALPEFERRFVYGDTTDMTQPRERPADPRLALALCSGHMGDPPLAMRAYRSDSLDAQLDAAMRTTLALPRFASFNTSSNRLDLSDYLAQRRSDFGGTMESILPYLGRYGSPDVRKGIRKGKHAPLLFVIPADRSLNQWPRPKSAAGAPAISKS